jgi:hypothetical protein
VAGRETKTRMYLPTSVSTNKSTLASQVLNFRAACHIGDEELRQALLVNVKGLFATGNGSRIYCSVQSLFRTKHFLQCRSHSLCNRAVLTPVVQTSWLLSLFVLDYFSGISVARFGFLICNLTFFLSRRKFMMPSSIGEM